MNIYGISKCNTAFPVYYGTYKKSQDERLIFAFSLHLCISKAEKCLSAARLLCPGCSHTCLAGVLQGHGQELSMVETGLPLQLNNKEPHWALSESLTSWSPVQLCLNISGTDWQGVCFESQALFICMFEPCGKGGRSTVGQGMSLHQQSSQPQD